MFLAFDDFDQLVPVIQNLEGSGFRLMESRESLNGTLRDFDYREVKVSQAIIKHAREVWVAADHSKFNRPAMVEVAHLSAIDRLFTDIAPPEPFPRILSDAQVQCELTQSSQP